MTPQHDPHGYRPEIDGLRALAVVAVILNHFERDLLPSGYLGVDIFFVISGYVITASLSRSKADGLGQFLLDFYVRRIKRIAPALVVFAAIVGPLICLIQSNPEVSLMTGASALFGFSNVYLFAQSTDYFAEATELNVFAHTWSLGVEEQFYFVFPLLVWMYAFRRAEASPARLAKATAILSAITLVLFVALYDLDQPAAYFLMPARFWELGAGALVYLGAAQAAAGSRPLPRVPPLPVALALLATLFAPLDFAVPATVAVVALSAALIASLRAGSAAHAFFTLKPVVYIGLISYSLYLWHWGVLSLSRWTIGIDLGTAPFQVGAMLLAAMGSYHLIERPLRYAVWSPVAWRSIGYGLAAAGAVAGLLVMLNGPLDRWLYLGRILNVATPEHLERTWWKDKRTGEDLAPCHIGTGFEPGMLQTCLGPPAGDRPKTYLIGDSFARNYLPAVRSAFSGMESVYITMGGCAFLPPEQAAQKTKYRCADYARETRRYLIDRVRPGDTVFIGQRVNPGEETAAYFEHIVSFAKAIEPRGARAVLLDGTVPLKLYPEECVELPWRRGHKAGCQLPETEVARALTRFDEMARDAARSSGNLYYAPLRLGLCHGGVCGQMTAKGTPIWHDRGHITEAAAQELAPLLRDRLTEAGFK